MERLEAALEKARKSRQEVRKKAATKTANGSAKPEQTPVAEKWHRLKEFKISGLAARRNRITTLTQNNDSTPYDMLRSRALRLMRANGWKTLAVTSPNSNCGKTTVTANLAFSLARRPDLRIMVLDMDLRRPALNKVVGHKPSGNLHEVLEGKIRAEDQFVRFGENLIFGLNNRPARNPSELLQETSTQKKIQQICEIFEPDVVIFDMPPMLVSDDNVGFLPSVDCGLLVSAADSTTVTQLDNCEKELSELTNVLGVVLNKCRFIDSDTGYESDYY